jgi:integrase
VNRLSDYLGGLALKDLDSAAVMRCYQRMEKDEVPTSSARAAGVRLRQACKYMVKLRVLTHNPAEGIYLPKHTPKDIHPLTQDQARHLLQTARDGNCPLYAMWALALDTGARRGELLAVEPGDLDLSRGEVNIYKAVKESGGKGVRVEECKTKHSRRRLRIAPGTVAALEAHLSRSRASGGGPIFCGLRGKPLYSADLYHDYWWPLLERAGLDIRLHDLRHTCATLLLMAGVHIKAVSERLGHSSVTITLETYAHVLPTMQDAVAGVVEGLLWAS